MRAVAVTPPVPESTRLIEIDKPQPGSGQVLVRTLRVGVCGTDIGIHRGTGGRAPAGSDYLIIGHESVGQVEEVGRGVVGLAPGDYVTATVRRPCAPACLNCAQGQSDMCLTGGFADRGVLGLHGYLSEYYLEEPAWLVKVPPTLKEVAVLAEPLSVVEKAVAQVFAIQGRLFWEPRRAAVVGTGAIGLLAAALLRLRGLEVHTFARTQPGGARLQVTEAMGATYWSTADLPLASVARELGPADIIIEASGSAEAALTALDVLGTNGILCLIGVYPQEAREQVALGRLGSAMVDRNQLVFGTVNGNRGHFEMGVAHMAEMEQRWPGLLASLFTRRLPLNEFEEAFQRPPGEIKTVIQVSETTD
jgi:threonine dehydrogenase-like Zn-dependent dehydrogenase